MVESMLLYVQQNIAAAPFIIFFLLFIAGFNIPVSEDLIIIASAFLAIQFPSATIALFLALHLGAYSGDLVCYWIGRLLGRKVFTIWPFKKMMNEQKMKKIEMHFLKHGFLTFVIGRFIPFGVRNLIFLTAGLGCMNFFRFAVYDFIAVTISVLSLYSLSLYVGEEVISYNETARIVLFSIILLILSAAIIIKTRKKNCKPESQSANSQESE